MIGSKWLYTHEILIINGLMFRRIASVAILLMLILSFTVGSAGYATAYQTVTTVAVMEKPSDMYHGPRTSADPIAVGIAAERFNAVPPDMRYATVVVDMDSIQFEPPLPGRGQLLQGQLFTNVDAMVLTGNYIASHMGEGALVGNVMLYEPGNMTPKEFPMRWEVNGSRDHGKPQFFGHMKIAAGSLDSANMSGGMIEFSSSIVLDEAAVAAAYAVSEDSGMYTSAVEAGDDNWHTVNVGDAIDSMDVDLKWEDGDSDLRLMIFTPDGKVLGPYYDDADGNTDGRIYLNISNTEGLAAGEWYLKVTDTDPVGDTDYYVKTS